MRHWRACPNETLLGKPNAPWLVQNVHGRRIGNTQQPFTIKEERIKIVDSSITQAKRRRHSSGVFYLFIAIGLVVAIGLSFGLNVLVPRMQRDAPEQLGNLELIGTVRSAEAMAQINRLHGLDINLVDAFVATYTHKSPYHGNSQATIWVGRAKNTEAASRLTQRMVDSINEGGSAFNNLQRLTVADLEVFQIDGSGGRHFFYNSQKQREAVVWLTIEADDPLPILKETVKIF